MVAVGWEGDPFGRKVLGLLVSLSVVSVSIGAEETTGIFIGVFPPETSVVVVVSTGNSVVVSFCLLTVAKKFLVDAIASSLLASLVPLILLGDSTQVGPLSVATFNWVLGVSTVSSVPPTAAGKLQRDPSGVMFKVKSILMSSYLGGVGVRHPLIVEYC